MSSVSLFIFYIMYPIYHAFIWFSNSLALNGLFFMIFPTGTSYRGSSFNSSTFITESTKQSGLQVKSNKICQITQLIFFEIFSSLEQCIMHQKLMNICFTIYWLCINFILKKKKLLIWYSSASLFKKKKTLINIIFPKLT